MKIALLRDNLGGVNQQASTQNLLILYAFIKFSYFST